MNTDHTRIKENLYRSLYEGLGESVVSALDSGLVEELMLNPDGRFFVKYTDGTIVQEDNFTKARAEIVVRTIASLNDREIDEEAPMLECELERFSARFSALMPPLSRGASFTLRVLKALNLSFDELLLSGFIKDSQARAINSLIEKRKNFLICGQTGCGKTSFINSILNRITKLDPACRIICIEDTPELKLSADNCVNLFTCTKTSMSDLVRASLRFSPDRIVVGEIRSIEALDMIDAFSTGHKGGVASIHAGSALQCLDRLKLLISRHPYAPAKGIDELIALSLDAVIVLGKRPYRHVESIVLVKGYSNNAYVLEEIGI